MPDITSAPYGCSSNSIQPIIIAFGEGLDISLSSLHWSDTLQRSARCRLNSKCPVTVHTLAGCSQ